MVTIKWKHVVWCNTVILHYDWNDYIACDVCNQHDMTFYQVDWPEYKGTLCLECYDEMISNPEWFDLITLVIGAERHPNDPSTIS